MAMFFQAVIVSGFVLVTYLLLHVEAPVWVVITIIMLAGAPMSTISVSSYQFAAEVTYPVEEVFGVGIMNTFNKLFTFSIVLIDTFIGPDLALILWMCLSILGVIPSFFV